MFSKKIIGLMACDPRGVIGNKGALPWHNLDEMKHFRDTTYGQVLIVGRKTFESMSEKLWKDRTYIVFSRKKRALPKPSLRAPACRGVALEERRRKARGNPDLGSMSESEHGLLHYVRNDEGKGMTTKRKTCNQQQANVYWISSLDELSKLEAFKKCKQALMIGGAQVAKLFLDNGLISEFILTKFHEKYDGDATLALNSFNEWESEVMSEQTDYTVYKFTKS